ncbi:MAG TPA: Wzz/FepE/Etk N-terminal domain-containing protein [Candidatus Krumholzibacteriaceae bacterium]
METVEVKRESTVKDFLEVIFRRKWIIIGIVAVATVVVIVLTLRQPAEYESTAKVLIKRGEAAGVFDRNVRTLNWEEEIASQIEMVKSQTVVGKAQTNISKFFPTGYKTDRKIVLARVNSGVITTSNVIWVTYSSEDPVFCEAAVNAIVNAYREYYANTRTPPEMEDFFSQEIDRLQEELEYWRDHKEKVLKDGDIVDIEEQRRSLLARIANYENELDDVVRERKDKEAVIGRLDSLLGAGVEDLAAVSSDLTGSQLEGDLMKDLRIKLQELRMKESELEGKYTDKNPEIQRIQKQIEDQRGMVVGEIRAQILLNKNKLAIIIQREETLRGLVARLELDKSKYPQAEVELERIDAALEKLKKTYDNVVEQQMEARISRASNPEWTVTILNPASQAYRKKTRDYVRMALGPAFSLIVALGLAFFIDNLDHSIKNISEAEESLGLSVLASFPETNRR